MTFVLSSADQSHRQAEQAEENAVDGEGGQAAALKIAQQPADAQVAADGRGGETEGNEQQLAGSELAGAEAVQACMRGDKRLGYYLGALRVACSRET